MANTQVREDQRVAEATLNNMAQQRERLLGFEKKFDSIDYYIGSARKTIATMSRRAIANKIILAVIILVLIGAIGLIIWLKFRGGDSGGTTDTTTTTTSTTGGPTTSDSTSTSTSTTSTSTSTTGSTIGTSTSTTGGSTSS
ncbi:putative v-SNARE family protein [Heterostelium album PN500]|uniref:Putative v-SNARE family protein n=1 Tax=Heterostelium pallidum (strain ATCC 26659 / Pp 5 / PN500) TaxID=670386 RepID=D3AWC4_HETP5|nr:putative v-SNARE family protein [Heterostelium album PN500]EFA86597.1 putative v-SNARE family protein [Heterostelium album PN500]|eukprot:XP_020438702.1 putative v-SNARE family protein [Heterostelium album PN500]